MVTYTLISIVDGIVHCKASGRNGAKALQRGIVRFIKLLWGRPPRDDRLNGKKSYASLRQYF